MIETLRRYWICLLVLVLIGLHASIVAGIRIQANQVKSSQSCEVDLGSYFILDTQRNETAGMRLHALVPVDHRLQSRQLIEINQFQVRQSLEEYCRQADPLLLTDPFLVELKTQLLDTLIQTVGETAAVDVVITDFQPSQSIRSFAFSAPTSPTTQRKRMVITRQATDEARKAAHEAASHGDGGHGGGGHGDAHGGGHGDEKGGGHGGGH
jgi:hypothetical protein